MLITKWKIAVAVLFAVAALCAVDAPLLAQQKKEQPKKQNQFDGTIKKIEGNKVTITKMENKKKVDVTLNASDKAKVIGQFPDKLKIGDLEIDVDPAQIKIQINDMNIDLDEKLQFAIPNGVKGLAEMLSKLPGGVEARITTDQNNNITEIVFKFVFPMGDGDGNR